MVFRPGLIAAAIGLLVTGCARLSVNVDVLDPEYVHQVRSELRLNRLIRESAAGDGVVELAVRDVCTAYQHGRLALYDVTLKKLNAVPSPPIALTTAITTSQASRDLIAQQPPEQDCVKGQGTGGFIEKNDLLIKFRKIACPDAGCIDGVDSRGDLRSKRLMAAIEYQGLLDINAGTVNERLGRLQGVLDANTFTAALPAATQVTTKNAIQNAQSDARREAAGAALEAARQAGYLGAAGRTLVLDEIAFAALKAEDAHWAEELNVAKGNGIFGSTDVVLKLESTGDFSVKGLVFDARSTALAARKVSLSTLQILAAGSGLPLSGTQGGSGDDDKKPANTAATEASQSLAAAKAKLAADELAANNYKAALRRIAAAAIATADNATAAGANPSQIQASRATTKAIFDANRPLLQAQVKESSP